MMDIKLADGNTLPKIAFGTWLLDNTSAVGAVRDALREGYRLIDTAMRYHNEMGVGAGLAQSGVDRETYKVASKVRGGDQGYDGTVRAFNATLTHLGLDYVDFYYVHWPLPKLDWYVPTFRAMQDLRDKGKIRSLAVSNFNLDHLDRLKQETGEYPVINQVEIHPGFAQRELVEGCRERGIAVQAWGAIGRGKGMLELPEITRVAAETGLTPAQVALRFTLDAGACPLAKSNNPVRRAQNLAAAELAPLSREHFELLEAMDYGRQGKDPEVDEEY